MLENKAFAYRAAEILAQHNALDVLVMDISQVAGWADYFVIATCTSSAHMNGLQRHIEEFLQEEHVEILNKPNVNEDQQWLLLDAGNVILHIMSKEARNFYDLESLWFSAPRFLISLDKK